MGTNTGTHRGELLGIAATNKNLMVSGITIHQIADGKILESTAVWGVIASMQ
jgi:predicted ester cyclase